MAPWRDWDAAARGTLRFLHDYLGWDVWLVTHVEDDVQRVVHAHPDGAVRPGTELAWERSFCRQMIEGRAPRVATVTAAVPEYASRTTGLIQDVAAYIGVPLVTREGQLHGTLCAVAFRARPRSAARDLPLVETSARMLSTLLATFDDRQPGAGAG
ncbi:GAF domain-containing protein [Blastococcus saxobsidens]|uniref:GAF domain-containing protein n=1 Tax=Blastococcus saxobsidens TaxID=138336 RepID=UPI00140FC157|nr:GAF domain-containing protein [Blastococcus saxobsidens]